MSSLLTLSSAALSLTQSGVDPSDFTIVFSPPIDLGSLNYEVALLKANLWFTSLNVIDKTILWSSNGGYSFNELILPDGNYTIDDINYLLQLDQIDKGVTDVDDLGVRTYGITMYGNYNTNRGVIQIDNTVGTGLEFQVDFTDANSLAAFLGFDEQIIDETASSESIAQVNGDDDAYQIRTDLVSNSYDNGSAAQILYSFVPAVPPGANIEVDPTHLVYLQVNKSTIYSINIKVTNQNGTKIDFNGEDTVFYLMLRSIGKPE